MEGKEIAGIRVAGQAALVPRPGDIGRHRDHRCRACHRVILIGLLIAGPCCVLLTGRWIPAGLTGLWVIGLAVVLGLPDSIWGTSTHLAFLATVIAVAMVSTLAAALIEIRAPPHPPALNHPETGASRQLRA